MNAIEEETLLLQEQDSKCDGDETGTASNLSTPPSIETEVKTVDWDEVADLVAEMLLVNYRREQHGSADTNGQKESDSKSPENVDITVEESRGEL